MVLVTAFLSTEKFLFSYVSDFDPSNLIFGSQDRLFLTISVSEGRISHVIQVFDEDIGIRVVFCRASAPKNDVTGRAEVLWKVGRIAHSTLQSE